MGRRGNFVALISCMIAIELVLSSCGAPGLTPTVVSPTNSLPSPSPVLKAEVVFQVDVPRMTENKQPITIDILDDVTGLALNPTHYLMEQVDKYRYVTRISIPLGSVVKYRYWRNGNPQAIEFTPNGKQVRFRLLKVTGPVICEDQVSSWTDYPYQGAFGRITGQVVDAASNQPLPNLLVTAGGTQTFTASDGSYLLEGMPPGTHRIVALDLDGNYDVFQQGATVAAETSTPAPLKLSKTAKVEVTFNVHPPQGGIKGIPIRLIGSIYSLGNTFSDMAGGLNVIASRAPLLALQPDGTYQLKVSLPVGLDLRYKYSLGDGFWNSELTESGKFNVRQIVIPNKNLVINDFIQSWQQPGFAPITFTVKVPDSTPQTDSVSMQFNPFGWTEPIPIWPLGNNQWMYVLYNPLSIVNSVGYRYCRNGQCGVADDDATKGSSTHGLIFTPSRLPQNLQDEVKKWAWMPTSTTPTTVIAPEISGRGASFTAGIELQSKYQPVWQSQLTSSLKEIKDLGANWVTFTPTWSYTRQNPPVLEAVAGKDPFWQDLIQMTTWATDKKLNLAIFPSADIGSKDWWSSTTRDANWWQTWFDRYQAFLFHFADLASQTKAGTLIIGEKNAIPALTGTLPNGSSSNLPSDSAQRWSKMLAGVRARFKGKVYLALTYPGTLTKPPKLIDEVDGAYVLWSASLSVNPNFKEEDIAKEFSRLLDQDVMKLKENIQKPVLIGIQYGSFDGAFKSCVQTGNECKPVDVLDQPVDDLASVTVDLQEQLMLYNAFLTSLNQRKWIDGVISRGFYPPAQLQDKSASIHGKPASDAIWYWFPKLLANPK